jgi:hypothetical protein
VPHATSTSRRPRRRADESGPLPQFSVELSDADRTLEYQGRRAGPEPDDRVAAALPSLVAAALDRARAFGPVTIREADTTEEIDIDVEAISVSPDASLSFPHPVDPALFADDSSEVFDLTQQMRPVRGDPRWKIAAFGAAITAAAMLLGVGLARQPVSAATLPVEVATPPERLGRHAGSTPALSPFESIVAPVTVVPGVAPPPVPPAPTTGIVTSPKWAKGRRVIVDGKVAGQSPRVEIACGKHTVRIGTAGRLRTVDVPCGGSIAVSP